MEVTRYSRNIHQMDIGGDYLKLAVIGDIHWDNPKCDREKLKRDLDYCLEHDIKILGIGDWFCLMQGKGDRRGNKSDIRDEHNNSRYLDSVVETAVEYFSPYAHLIQVVGYGNHETSIIKHQETDIIARFVDLMNYKNGTKIESGGYGGWFLVKMKYGKNKFVNFRIKYFHGSGGGGPVTQGAINLTRALGKFEGADVYCMGHVHENSSRVNVRETLKISPKYGPMLHYQEIHQMICGTYKEEWDGGFAGFHVERGAGIKPIGARILLLKMIRKQIKGQDCLIKKVDSVQFPY